MFEPIRDIVIQHQIETRPYGPGDMMLGKPIQRRVWHSIYSAAKTYQCHPKRLRKILASRGILPEDHATKSNERVLFDATKGDELFRLGVFHGLPQTKAEQHLNAGRAQTKLLADSGLIKPAVDTDEVGIGWYAFTIADLDAFLERLSINAVDVNSAPIGAFDIPGAAKRANCSAVEIINLIFDGKLPWVGRLVGERGYAAILVDLDSVKSHVHQAPLDGLTARDIEKRLDSSGPVVRALLDNGILKRVNAINPINRCPIQVVPLEQFNAFVAEFESLYRLAKHLNLHPRKALKRLEEAGVQPAFDPEIYHARFYRRSEAEAVFK